MRTPPRLPVSLAIASLWLGALAFPIWHEAPAVANSKRAEVRELFFADPGAGVIHRVRATFKNEPKLKVLDPIAAVGNPTAVAVDPGGQFLLALDSSGNRLVKYDVESQQDVDRLRLGDGLVDVAITPDGEFAYVTDAVASQVHVVDTRRLRVVRSIDMLARPTSIAITRKGNDVYVVDPGADVISRIDNDMATASETRIRSDRSPVVHLSRAGDCDVSGGIDTLRVGGANAFNFVMWTCGGASTGLRAREDGADFEEDVADAPASSDSSDNDSTDTESTDESVDDDSSDDDPSDDDSSDDDGSDDDGSDDDSTDSESTDESVDDDSSDDDSTDSEASDDSADRVGGDGLSGLPIPTSIPGRPDGYVATDIERAATRGRRNSCETDWLVISFRPGADAEPQSARTFIWKLTGSAKEMAPGVAFHPLFGGAGDSVYVNAPCKGNCTANQVVRRTRQLQIPGAVDIVDGATTAMDDLDSCSPR